MTSVWGRALALAALLGWAVAGHAADAVPTAKTGLEHVRAQKRAAYEAVLGQFDRAIAAAPDNASLGVARCEYIAEFTDEEGEWIEGAYEAYEACAGWLQERWPATPAAQLFELQQAWGKEAIAVADTLGDAIDGWPAPLRMRAFAHLANAYESTNDRRAGEYALRAAELGHVGSVGDAIDHLVARKQYARATRLLDTAAVPEGDWTATSIVRSALALPDRQAAWRTVQRFEQGGIEELSAAVAASAQMRAGDLRGARKRLGDEPAVGVQDRKLAFDIAVAARDVPAALAYIEVGEMDEFEANLGRFAILATTLPTSLFSTQMLAMGLVLVLVIGAIALLPGIVLAPVHYRGLARRLRHLPQPALFQRASLLRAWYGLAVVLCVPTLAMFVFAPQAVEAMFASETGAGLFGGLLWGTVASLAFLVPAAIGMSPRELVGDRGVWRAWKRLLLAWVALMGITLVLHQYHQWTGGGGETSQTRMVETLVGEGNVALGGFGALLLVGFLGPVVEELVFRGLLLGGLARHISFRWANGLQALGFALAHDDPPRFVFYLAMGLLCGWLVKSTRSLGPAIALHAINNALFVVVEKF